MEMLQIEEEVRKYIAEREISQSGFAKLIGIAESTFSRWLSGNYPNGAIIKKKVEDFLAKEETRQEVKDVRDIVFAMTGISKNIWATLDYCRVQRQIVCIYGDAGCGKTFTAREWMKGKTDVVFLTGSPAVNSPKAFLKLLARKLKTRLNGNKDDLYFDVIEKLEGSDRTIIIDEAQHFNVNTIEMIRSVQNATSIGLALIGNPVIYNRLLGKQEAEFAQLFSRLMMRKNVLTDQFVVEDVRSVFGMIGQEEEQYMLSICKSRYGLRGAVFLYMNAMNNDNVTKRGLQAMAKEMGILIS